MGIAVGPLHLKRYTIFSGQMTLFIMTAKSPIEIKVKFDRIPLADPDHKGYTKIEILTEKGYVVLADIKTKTYKRFLENARRFGYWEAALSGRLYHIQGHQLILEKAGLQCYEKKPKSKDSYSDY
mgnify:CR=1 FL=1